MPTVTYIEPNGTQHRIDLPSGISVMRGAVDNDVPAIDADCGGQCACATCHVYVDPEWVPRTGRPGEQEEAMLAFVNDLRPTSRLSCQITVGDELDGLLVRLPDAQH